MDFQFDGRWRPEVNQRCQPGTSASCRLGQVAKRKRHQFGGKRHERGDLLQVSLQAAAEALQPQVGLVIEDGKYQLQQGGKHQRPGCQLERSAHQQHQQGAHP